MKILVVNDDGINAQGIRELTKALSEVAEVYVCAPKTQKSAAGHGISIHGELEVLEQKVEGATAAYSIDGSPADCTKLGLHFLKEQGIEIDIVFSGINHGGNMGTDTLYSGTVSAAIEGNLCGKPAVAVSVNDHYPNSFDYASNLAKRFAKDMIEDIKKAREEGKLYKYQDTTLNLNVPNIPANEIKGLRKAVLGPREYTEWFTKLECGDVICATNNTENGAKNQKCDTTSKENEKVFRAVYEYTGQPVVYTDLPENYDVMLIQKGYATITPLKHDFTDFALLEDIEIL